MRSTINKNKARLALQNANMIENYKTKKLEEEVKATEAKKQELLEGAYRVNGFKIHNDRTKKQEVIRNVTYNEHFTALALTEALTYVVENSLLLNKEEYEKLNPNYKAEIKATVRGFLENADINENINNETILKLYENIKENTPDASYYLSEEDENGLINRKIMSDSSITRSLDTLCRDVKARVANIVSKDQEKNAAEQNALDFIATKEMEKAPLVPVEPAPVEQDPYAPLPDPEQPAPVEEVPAETVEEQPAPVTESVTIKKSVFIKESKKSGIVETLAINEAKKMLEEGKEYDSTLALANSIKLITCLEALDASGIVTIGKEGYDDILKKSGADMTKPETLPTDIKQEVLADKKPELTAETHELVEPEEKEFLDKKEAAIDDKLADVIKTAIPTGAAPLRESSARIFVPFNEWMKKNNKEEASSTLNESSSSLFGKYSNKKGEIFTESQMKTFFEDKGYDVELMSEIDFDNLCYTWNFIKHN